MNGDRHHMHDHKEAQNAIDLVRQYPTTGRGVLTSKESGAWHRQKDVDTAKPMRDVMR